MSTTRLDPETITPEEAAAAHERAIARFFTASEHAAVVRLRTAIVALGREIDLLVPPGPQKAIALTELESVQMRANRGLFAPIPEEQRR